MRLEQLETIQAEQNNFSRDLHDGVAQNLVALNIYLEKEDFEKIIREICSAFEVNFGIKTKCTMMIFM